MRGLIPISVDVCVCVNLLIFLGYNHMWYNMCMFRFVGLFMARKDRNKDQGKEHVFTNVFIKNFGEDFTDEQLQELFSQFGTVVSHVVMKSHTGRGKGFGFVSFETHEMALKVCVYMGEHRTDSK